MPDETVSFSEASANDAIEAAKKFYSPEHLGKRDADGILSDDGHISILAECIKVTVKDGKVCVVLPLKIGKVCLPVPKIFPNGTVAEACLHVCSIWGIPTGVRVTVSVAGKVIITKVYGKC